MRESQLVALETGQTYVSSLVDVESENICVTPLEVAKLEKQSSISLVLLRVKTHLSHQFSSSYEDSRKVCPITIHKLK
uniref:Uncharacterized protein n=1 Tax=Solanum tuberosum TaxID=4113 RepID=M0ZNA4_SOLTU